MNRSRRAFLAPLGTDTPQPTNSNILFYFRNSILTFLVFLNLLSFEILLQILITSDDKPESVFKTEIAQQPDTQQGSARKEEQKVKLPGKLPNEHRIRNIEEVKVVLKACRPKDSHAIDDVQMATGQVLYPPAITYGSNEEDREELGQHSNTKWKIPHDRRFVFPAQFPQHWVVIIFQGCDVNECSDFIKTFVKTAQRRGMRATPPKEYDVFENTDVKYIGEKFESYKKCGVQYAMFFTKDKDDSIHDTMKLMAIKLDILTQHIPEETMKTTLGNNANLQVIGSIVMNFNRKLGGINHGLSTSKAMSNANRFTHDVVKQEWLRESRMFIGLDMNHASRQMGEKSIEPTIVSMAYTVGHPLKISLYSEEEM
ncbi:piwi domain-containing protein [Ditylenchus destructor]|nr:piwi domain-containing protein [Ditylenchus destructor]